MAEESTIAFKVNDKPYSVDVGKFTGIEIRDFENAVGTPLFATLNGVGTGTAEPMMFVAGTKWLIDRRSNPSLTFDEVLGSITYDGITFEGEVEVSEDPPTQGEV